MDRQQQKQTTKKSPTNIDTKNLLKKQAQKRKKKSKKKEKVVEIASRPGKAGTSPDGEADISDNNAGSDVESKPESAGPGQEASKENVLPKQGSEEEIKLPMTSDSENAKKSKEGSKFPGVGSGTIMTMPPATKSGGKPNEKNDQKYANLYNDSLRWEYSLEDEAEEEERIRLYKINRRKRYLEASNKQNSDLEGDTVSLESCRSSPLDGDGGDIRALSSRSHNAVLQQTTQDNYRLL